MTIPKLTPYTGQVANPDGSQTQTEFTQNMFDQLSYEAQLATQLDATIDGMNNAVDEVEANATSAESSANAAEAAASSAGYKGLWPDTGGSALKGETWQTQVGGTPTGEYYTALQNTSVDPAGDNVNWKFNINAEAAASSISGLKIQRDVEVGTLILPTTEAVVLKNHGERVYPLLRKFTVSAPIVSFTTSGIRTISTGTESTVMQDIKYWKAGKPSGRSCWARSPGVTDDTDSINAALLAGDPFDDEVSKRSCFLEDGVWRVYGDVFVRKGQSLYANGGQSARLDMGVTGGITLGKDLYGNEDPTGSNPKLKGFTILGGLKPFQSEISGYSIEDLFISAPVGSSLIGGTDAQISGLTMDQGSSLLTISGGGHTFTRLNLFTGNTQLTLFDTVNNCTFNACLFSYANQKAINFLGVVARNIVFNSCVFQLNIQNPTFESFIKTQSFGANTLSIESSFNACSFYNMKDYAFDISSGTNHKIDINNCILDGSVPRDGFTPSTTSKAFRFNADQSTFNIRGGTIRNMVGLPVEITGGSGVSMETNISSGTIFTNNGGDVDIDIKNLSPTSKTRLNNIIGSGRRLFRSTNPGHDLELHNLQDWFRKGEFAGRSFAAIPWVGAANFDVSFIVNPTDGSGSSLYRTVEDYKLAVYHGTSGGQPASKCKLIDVAIFDDLGVERSDLTVEFDTIGGGDISIGSFKTDGELFLSWDNSYVAGVVNVQPNLMRKVA